MKVLAIITLGVYIGISAFGADAGSELARLLASEGTRQAGISRVMESPAKTIPFLLSWTRTPPADVDAYQLYISLAEVFADLKTEAAVPFLIKNINLKRGGNVDFAPWLKTPESIEQTFPAINALIRIGPAASKQVMAAARGPMTSDARLAAIFVVGRIKGVTGSRDFLRQAEVEAKTQANWADLGMKELEK